MEVSRARGSGLNVRDGPPVALQKDDYSVVPPGGARSTAETPQERHERGGENQRLDRVNRKRN